MYDSFINQNRSLTINASGPDWDGCRSQKFKKGIRLYPSRDLIKDCTNMPNQTILTGRSHFVNEASPEYLFKRPKKQVKWDEYWHPRQSQIKTFDFKPTNPPPRRQRRHLQPLHNPQTRYQSIQTSFMEKYMTTKEYLVQDKMQRKIRIQPLQLKRNYYKDLDIFKKPRNYSID